ETMQQIVDDYGDQVAWVYRHFPLDSLHAKARIEAEATECAADQGGNDAFWAFTDRLFEITPSNDGLNLSQLPEIAGDVGLDVGVFQTCLDSGKFADKVEAQYQDAVTAGGNGTPYSVAISASGETVPISGAQPVSALKSIIDSLL
ncbi:thioredoxin domain-containing protein, partial [Patescibacteria group bacterium]|nr:thioredoxin domain-containing protein [Patescibacteria group bacterium]